MSLNDILVAIENTGIATSIREGETTFPWIESVHVLAIATVVGSIAIIDMRLLGVSSHVDGVRRLMRDLLPFTWAAFVVALITGVLLFSSRAIDYTANTFFDIKMLLIVVAGVNMIFFHFLTQRSIEVWDEIFPTPTAAKFAGASSLALWAAVIACGRWIGFTL